jgi:hypothetical protein
VKPEFRVEQRDGYWSVDVFYTTTDQGSLFNDWAGFEEPFPENVYHDIKNWCEKTFKTWLYPRRVKRMSYTQFHFKSKKDLDWFILHWSSVDIPLS